MYYYEVIFNRLNADKTRFEQLAEGWQLNYLHLREYLGDLRIYFCVYKKDSNNISYGFHMNRQGLFINDENLLKDTTLKSVFDALEGTFKSNIKNWRN